jgi:DNA-binding NtrC family response regulator
MEKMQTAAEKKEPRVLIIDDEPYVTEMLVAELEERKIFTVTSGNGTSAFSLIEKERPDLIISDHRMPGLSGIELLSFLRSLRSEIPVIWITGNADDETMREAWRLGVYHLFQKPFNPEEVANEVSRVLKLDPEMRRSLHPRGPVPVLVEI